MNPIRRLTAADVQDMIRQPGGIRVPKNAHVVIPAKNAEAELGRTLRYLTRMGFARTQVHVIVNGSTDDTEGVARRSGRATVHLQDELIDGENGLMEIVEGRFGIGRSRLKGKGTAIFAGMLALSKLEPPDDAPIIFLDADISNVDVVWPVHHLLAGWHAWSDDPPSIIKLASQGRDNAGIMAFLNAMNLHAMASFEWPLCGQIIVPWGVLSKMRLTTGYCVETAMMIDCHSRQGDDANPFGEVCLGTPLRDSANPETKDVAMFFQIMLYLQAVQGQRTHEIEPGHVRTINRRTSAQARLPSMRPGAHPTRLTDVPLDAILPSLQELREARASDDDPVVVHRSDDAARHTHRWDG